MTAKALIKQGGQAVALVRVFLLTICMFINAPLDAKEKSKSRVLASIANLDPQEAIIVNYFRCFDLQDNEKIRKCFDPLLYPKLSKSQKDRFYSWPIMFNVHLTSFGRCSFRKVRASSFFPEATNDFSCGQVRINEKEKEVMFFFKFDKGKPPKLFSIYY